MADIKIIDSVKERLTSEEWLNITDYIRQQINYKDREDYDKGYQAGKKFTKDNQGEQK